MSNDGEPQPGQHCRSSCQTRDHLTWGECARAARIAIDKTALAQGREE